MTFPGGEAPLPGALTCSGLSGPTRIWPTEQPRALDRLSDDQLERLAEELGASVVSALESGDDSQLTEYTALLSAQVQGEMLRRRF